MNRIISLMLVFVLSIFFAVGQNTNQTADISQAEVKQDFENGIVKFVSQIKQVMPEGSLNYQDFKTKLIGLSNLSTISTEGDNLLNVTYTLIKTDASNEQIKLDGLIPFANATKFILEYEGIGNNYSGPTWQNGSVALFGGNSTSIKDYETVSFNRSAAGGGGGCGSVRDCNHWYQFGCHAHNVGVWICNHQGLLAGIFYIVGTIFYLTH